tara:strand:+ start:1227 stop:1502 length:276 start_codon:yes stop_codon:yes gene_type:complete
MKLNLEDEDSVFSFLLSREINDIEKKYIENVTKLENTISKKIYCKDEISLMTNNSMFNSSKWINLKYIDMLILQITLDLITDNIINLMEKK